MSMTYKIRVHFENGAPDAWVAANDGRNTWDGAWFTHRERIKTWKTRRGAERWLKARPLIQGTIEEHIQ